MATEDHTGRPSAPGRVPSAVLKLALVIVALLVGLLAAELLVRFLGFSAPVYVWTDPVRGVAHVPGATGGALENGHYRVEINSDGWRGPEVPLKKTAGTFRIALLGDSFIEAFEVPFEETVGELLERRLTAVRGGPVEVLNFGQGGYGTTQELLTLRHEVWKYSPDLILLAITTANDISDNHRALKHTDYVPYYVYQGDELVLDKSFRDAPVYRSRALWTKRLLAVLQHSRVAQLVNRVRHLSRKGERRAQNVVGVGNEEGIYNTVYLPPTTPEWQEAWRVTEGVLRLMGDECRARHTPLALVTLSSAIQVSPIPEDKARFLHQIGARDLYYPERRLSEFAKLEGIPILNLAPPMARLAEQRRVYFHAEHDSLGVGHWNRQGHQAAAELLTSWLGPQLTREAR